MKRHEDATHERKVHAQERLSAERRAIENPIYKLARFGFVRVDHVHDVTRLLMTSSLVSFSHYSPLILAYLRVLCDLLAQCVVADAELRAGRLRVAYLIELV